MMSDTSFPRHAAYVGSFDPLSLGHLDIIVRGAELFDHVTVGVGINPDKKPLFPPDERVRLIEEVVKDMPRVSVSSFRGLSVDFVRQVGAGVMLRGMRTLSDIEAEFTMTLANRALAPEIETVFLMASEKYTHVSSTLIKQVAQLGGNDSRNQLRAFVPEEVVGPLLARFRDRA